MCPNTEYFLVCIFLYLDWIRKVTEFNLRIQPEYRKIRATKNPVFGHFSYSVDYLSKLRDESCHFYWFSKTHKSNIISKAIEEQNSEYIMCFQPQELKSRPILTGNNCPTKRLNNFVNILSEPFLTKVASCLRDDLIF